MSLHPVDRSEIPTETAQLGQELLAEDNLYRQIGERLSDLIEDEDFADIYSPIGGPALSPVILSLVLIFQMLEKLPDRLATEAVRLRIDWKYALHLPLDWTGFHFTNLSHFRKRLLEHGAEYRVFECLLQKLVSLGYVRRRGKQRTDSSHVLGLVAKLSRLELVWESVRMALMALNKQDAGWLERMVPEAFLQQYWQRRHDYNLSQREVVEALQKTGADGFWLLQRLQEGSAELAELAEVEILRQIWDQQFQWDEQGQYDGPKSQLDAHGLIQSPHEPEVSYRRKRDKEWQGYVAQVSETAEAEGEPNFITDVAITDAQTSDQEALADIQERLIGRDLRPLAQVTDQAYVSGKTLAESEQRDIILVGPIADQPGPEGFKLDDFQVDIEAGVAICPAGNQASRVSVIQLKDGCTAHRFFFGQQCASCPLRSACTQAEQGRTITYHEHHKHVMQRRLEMQTEGFWKVMQRRPPVEGTISQLMRMGMRQARYRGQRKVNLQLILAATATNIKRLCRVWKTERQPSW